MLLEEKLGDLRENSKTKFSPEIAEKMHRATKELRESEIMQTALKVGDKMPPFSLPNTKGKIISSTNALKKGNLVVTFYRGVW